jgi:hypothetical protein
MTNDPQRAGAPLDRTDPRTDRDEELWRDLLLLIEAGEVVPIVGRDLLEVGPQNAPSHLYTWLAGRVAARLGVAFDAAEATTDPLNTVACRYLEARSDPRPLYTTVYEEARGLPALGIPDGLLKLAALDKFRLFVTTTFDNALQRAIDQVRFGGAAVTEMRAYSPRASRDLPGPIDTLQRPLVFHLLGRVAPTDDYVVTEEDALEFVHSLQSGTRPATLFSELYGKDLLVIGCRFPTWLVRFFIRLARPDRLLLARGRTVFVVDTGAREDRALIEFLRAFKTRTEVFERQGPVHFVDELHARWSARTVRPPEVDVAAASQAPVAPGAIFLSYASEDRQVVESVAAALSDAKLDVWFDREQLMVGDAFEDRIRTNIERCALFVPVLSRHCAVRDPRFFRLEWKYALRKASMLPESVRFICPVVIDDLPPDDPAIFRELRELHWSRLADGVTRFVDSIKKHYRENQVV